jgi:hypothetical protein
MFVNRSVVVALALLLLTAGCLGGGSVPGAGDVGAAVESELAGADGSEGVQAPVSGADAADVAESADVDLAVAEARLREAGSFTSTWTYRGTDADGGDGAVSHTYYADLDGERTHVLVSTAGDDADAGWEQFSTGGTVYSRFGSGEGSFYQVETDVDADVVGDAVSSAGVYARGDLSDLSRVGTEQFDGVTVTRYELTDAESTVWRAGAVAAAAGGSAPDVEMQSVEYVVLVDRDGLARYESWTYTGRTADGRTVSGAWEFSLTAVGSTTFDDPEWLAEAEAQARAMAEAQR